MSEQFNKPEKKRKSGVRILAAVLICIAFLTLVSCVFISVFAKKHVDFEQDEVLFRSATEESVIRIYAGGEENPTLYEELCFSENRKMWVDQENVAECVKAAFLAAEDREFYTHKGVNLKRTVYAAVNLITKKQSVFGASTITQQVIKNISGDDEVTFTRKLSEILRAYHIEKAHSKDEILGVYLNIVPLSENVVGVGSGALTYFDKDVSKLNPAEAATLAGITNAPTRYNPYLHPEACLEKRNHVLYAMYDAGYLDEDEYRTYAAYPLGVAERKSSVNDVYSWFSETVMTDVQNALIESGYSENAAKQLLYRGGLSIYATVDPKIQKIMENYFENDSNLPAETKDGLSYAMCVLDSANGDLLGVIGNSREKTANRVQNYALSPHTPGSSLKPIALYAPLIDEGKINAATVFDDVPVTFSESNGVYSAYPQNSPKVYSGLTTVADAIRLSKNTVAVRLYGERGAEAIYTDLYRTFGFDTLIRKKSKSDSSTLTDLAVSPLALGQLTYGVSLRKLTQAYTVFPADGILRNGRSFTKVTDTAGNVLLENEKSEKRVYATSTARIMNQLLSGVVKDGTAKSVTLKNTIATAGKTGTSGDDKDRLFIGYTPYVTAGIWCGYQDGTRSVSSAAPSHLQIWDRVMTEIENTVYADHATPRSFSTDGLLRCSYCKDSGERFCPTCALDPRNDRMAYGFFTADNQPTGNCSRHIAVAYDETTDAIAGDGCPTEDVRLIALVKVDDRAFPKDIVVTDAGYVYRELAEGIPVGDSYDIPYFYYQIKDGVFVGRSPGSKQFNSFCYLHDDEEDEKSA